MQDSFGRAALSAPRKPFERVPASASAGRSLEKREFPQSCEAAYTRGPSVHSQSLQRWLTGSSYYEDTSPAARRLLSPLIYNRGQCPEPTIESASLPAAALLFSHRSGFKDQNRRRFQDHLFQRGKASSHD